MINKIKKYLMRHKEIVVYNKNESGSEYFKVGNSKIRVSDHLATSLNDPTTLNIVVNEDKFAIFYGNKLININTYAEFKQFLKYHILICNCFKCIMRKEAKSSKKSFAKPSIEVNDSLKSLIYNGEVFDLSKLTNKHLKGLKNMINNNSFPDRDSLVRYLKSTFHLDIN